jgi:pilus assembly protein Flp/PilA
MFHSAKISLAKGREGKMKKLIKFLKGEEGATAVEYGIMVALIAAVIVTIVGTLGTKISDAFQSVVTAL